jgi:hypothetical protein
MSTSRDAHYYGATRGEAGSVGKYVRKIFVIGVNMLKRFSSELLLIIILLSAGLFISFITKPWDNVIAYIAMILLLIYLTVMYILTKRIEKSAGKHDMDKKMNSAERILLIISIISALISMIAMSVAALYSVFGWG